RRWQNRPVALGGRDPGRVLPVARPRDRLRPGDRDMSPLFTTIISALAAILVVSAIYSILSDLFLRDRSRVGQRVDEEFRQKQRELVKKSPLFKNLSQMAAEAAGEDEGELSLRKRLALLVEQSGLQVTADKIMAFSVGMGLLVAAVVGAVRRDPLAIGVAAVI